MWWQRWVFITLLAALAGLASPIRGEEAHQSLFIITVVDEQTGRGVPLVELRTVSEIRFYTDSNGVATFNEPGLMGTDVFFFVKSHGYTFPADNFGNRGKTLRAVAGGSALLKIQRVNIAERLYRITGEGIYRDSVLAGKPAPIRQPVLNAQVSGQDSVQMTGYRGRHYWFWGDTNKPGHALGHFGTAGAISEKPDAGGLNPDKGIDLTYFVDGKGFSRKMCAWDEPGLKWIEGLLVIRDDAGTERMLARCSRMKKLGEEYDRSLVIFDDKTESFKPLVKLKADNELVPSGHSFFHKVSEQDYLYFATPFPTVRVKADFHSATDPQAYEAFTCLEPGSRYLKAESKLERTPEGRLVWDWKRQTAPITPARQQELLNAGKIKPGEAWNKLIDIESGKPVFAANGSIHYNVFRKRWIMILNQKWGTSMLGEVWYSEAEKPEGPWEKARKIVTHEQYSFYNVCHHPQFDQQGGRVIYFEGTYTAMFSGNPSPTPRYEYNQIMYRLDLRDPRLNLVEGK